MLPFYIGYYFSPYPTHLTITITNNRLLEEVDVVGCWLFGCMVIMGIISFVFFSYLFYKYIKYGEIN
jgi:hypothetical protein